MKKYVRILTHGTGEKTYYPIVVIDFEEYKVVNDWDKSSRIVPDSDSQPSKTFDSLKEAIEGLTYALNNFISERNFKTILKVETIEI